MPTGQVYKYIYFPRVTLFSFLGNVWSETAAMLGYGGGEGITVPVSIKTMEISTPYQCAAVVFLLMLI